MKNERFERMARMSAIITDIANETGDDIMYDWNAATDLWSDNPDAATMQAIADDAERFDKVVKRFKKLVSRYTAVIVRREAFAE